MLLSKLIALAVAVAGCSGCSGFINKQAANSTYGIMQHSRTAVKRSSDVELARAAAPGGIVQLEAFHMAYPGHRGFTALLAEGYCQYAAGFLNADWEQAVLAGDPESADRIRARALGHLESCVRYGMLLLGKQWAAAYEAGPAELGALVERAKKRDVAGLNWVAMGLSTGIAMEPTNLQRLPYLSVARAMLAKSAELDPAYEDATALVMLGAIDSSRPKWLGGDTEAGKAAFERARSLTENAALIVDVMLARTFGVAVGDRELFRATLERVVAADLTRWPARRLSNEIARSKARLYLAHEDQLFGAKPAGDAPAPATRTETAPPQ